jgi:two-component system, NarL family, response regulator
MHSSSASRLAKQMPDMTPREVEVVQFVVAGKSNKEIDQLLNATEGTVKVHVNYIFAKLGVDGRVAATLLALQRGIVHLPVKPAPKPASGDPPAKKLAR